MPGIKKTEIYSGVSTFLGLPKITTREELLSSDIVFMGVPWEGICTWGSFSGCELATKLIRNASVRYAGYLPDYDLDIFDYLSAGDYGDSAVQSGNYEFTFKSVAEKYKEILNAEKLPVVFGGDHSISIPLISEYAKRFPRKLGIIHFDAHMDNMEAFGDELLARCCPFHRLYEDSNIDPEKIVHIGIRGPRNNPSGLKEARRFGATVITNMEIKMKGYMESVRKAIEIASKDTEALYVTVCSDVLDVANNPGGPPDPCGMTTFELAMMLHECGKAGASAFDYVEIYPGTDPGNVSSHNAVWMTLYLLAGVTKRRFGL